MTSYINDITGDEIYSPMKIARNYILEGDFIVDFVSTVDIIGFFRFLFNIKNPSGVALAIQDSMSLLKVYRVRKLIKKIREVNSTV